MLILELSKEDDSPGGCCSSLVDPSGVLTCCLMVPVLFFLCQNFVFCLLFSEFLFVEVFPC
jgi:hypothetical protein